MFEKSEFFTKFSLNFAIKKVLKIKNNFLKIIFVIIEIHIEELYRLVSVVVATI